MKKISDRQYQRKKRFLIAEHAKEKRFAGWFKNKEFKTKRHKRPRQVIREEIRRRIAVRQSFCNKYYAKRTFSEANVRVDIPDNFGIEETSNIDAFFSTAMKFVDCRASTIHFDMTNATRVWPSALTLLASMKQWVRIVTDNQECPRIFSILPSSVDARSYLDHCGFNNYVKVVSPTCPVLHEIKKTVPLRRDHNNSNLEKRECELAQLVARYSGYTSDEWELLGTIITEIGLNVTEHGRQIKNNTGWWMLGQYHERHKMISICIADNGIGIRNSLLTGPQGKVIQQQLGPLTNNDGEYIKLAATENVSGAINASLKVRKAMILNGWECGARRGNGLKRILSSCSDLGITLTILSNSGYYSQPGNGLPPVIRSFDHRIFAGTMYHLSIDVERGHHEDN